MIVHTIIIPKDISTSLSSHRFFGELANHLDTLHENKICLDFSDTQFIASNQFAILGCILDSYLHTHPDTSIYFSELNDKLMEMIKKNGFFIHCNMERIPDIHNTVIPYKIFPVKDIKEYESYLTIKIFNRDDLPAMSRGFKSLLQDYLLEVFKNVADHTTSKRVYTCGQFFPKNSLLYFTIVDNGETIPYNVRNYFKHTHQSAPDNFLQWALMEGTSTANETAPRGIGLFLIRSFILANCGQLYIVSGKEGYEITGKGERFVQIEQPFPGTIVTLAFNLNDHRFYTMENLEIEEIHF